MYVRVYKGIGLSNDQRRFLADFWATWLRRRQVLDDELAEAVALIAALPTPACISQELLSMLDRAATAPPALTIVPLCVPDPDAADAPPSLAPHLVPRQLLGLSARRTKAADDAVSALVGVMCRDARQFEDYLSEFVLPQWFMTAAQRARLNCAHVRHACVPMEMLVVCRMAAMECRRESLTLPLAPAAPPQIARTYHAQHSTA